MRTESKIQRLCRQHMESRGLKVVRIDPTSSNGLKDWPDVLVVGVNGKVEWIEYKTAKGCVSPGQKIVLDMLNGMGHIARVVRCWDDVRETIERLA